MRKLISVFCVLLIFGASVADASFQTGRSNGRLIVNSQTKQLHDTTARASWGQFETFGLNSDGGVYLAMRKVTADNRNWIGYITALDADGSDVMDFGTGGTLETLDAVFTKNLDASGPNLLLDQNTKSFILNPKGETVYELSYPCDPFSLGCATTLQSDGTYMNASNGLVRRLLADFSEDQNFIPFQATFDFSVESIWQSDSKYYFHGTDYAPFQGGYTNYPAIGCATMAGDICEGWESYTKIRPYDVSGKEIMFISRTASGGLIACGYSSVKKQVVLLWLTESLAIEREVDVPTQSIMWVSADPQEAGVIPGTDSIYVAVGVSESGKSILKIDIHGVVDRIFGEEGFLALKSNDTYPDEATTYTNHRIDHNMNIIGVAVQTFDDRRVAFIYKYDHQGKRDMSFGDNGGRTFLLFD